jgi:hypothetical protein
MYADVVTIVVRATESAYDTDPDDVLAVRLYPVEDDVDASRLTDETRAWLHEGRQLRFLFEERRHFASVGAASASITFVLTMLGSGVTGVALQEVVAFIKSKVKSDADTTFHERRFRESSTEALRQEAVSAAEQALDTGSGDLEVEAAERDPHEIRLRVRRKSNGASYRVVKNADETLSVRKLGGA